MLYLWTVDTKIKIQVLPQWVVWKRQWVAHENNRDGFQLSLDYCPDLVSIPARIETDCNPLCWFLKIGEISILNIVLTLRYVYVYLLKSKFSKLSAWFHYRKSNLKRREFPFNCPWLFTTNLENQQDLRFLYKASFLKIW